MQNKFEKFLIVCIIVSILASGLSLVSRMKAEAQLNQVDIYVDYFEVNELARQSEHNTVWWLDYFRQLGATHVVLEEESLGLLRQALKPLRVDVGQDILKEWNWQKTTPSALAAYHETVGIRDYDVVIMTEEETLYQQIAAGLHSRYETDRFTLQPGDDGSVIIIHGTIEDAVYNPPADLTDFEGQNYFRERRLHSSQLTRLGLGFDQDKISTIQQAGLQVMPRPFSYGDWGGETYLRGYLDDLTTHEIIPDILFFGGKQLPGAEDESLSLLTSFMNQHGIRAGLVETSFQREHLEQEGIETLTESLDYQAVRVFNVWPFVQERYRFYHYDGAEEIENTLYRAVTERNIRMIYFKPFKESTTVYVTDPEEYATIFQRFETRIARHGLSLGKASVFPEAHPSLALQSLMALGVAAAAVLLLRKLFPLSDRVGVILFLMGIVPLIFLLFWRTGWGEKLTAMAAAILFPSLGMDHFCRQMWKWHQQKKRFSYLQSMKEGVVLLIQVSLISSIGALLVAALLSDVRYLLEMDIFRGVKISQLIPIAFYGLIFLHYFGYLRSEDRLAEPGIRPTEIRALLMENIKVLYVAAMGFLLVAGYIYIARTGHEGNLQPTEIEMIIRNILEESLLVRPRTKEFTVAFPALLLGAYLASLRYKSLIFLAGLAAVIGQTSIVNTFSHLRTPVLVSVIRTAYSMAAGIGFSVIYLALMIGFVWLLERWGVRLWRLMEKTE
ncbi:DUF5693 family protein [Anoxynatronum buryatiense]|uniref:Uncharacterized protein n=1 Tax=Anoxynatronum buryatiense TaxID=489973 RepID=A0AA45WU95_9CLOT|nr:DUF5693 family protein [Anoxynatronum buryatiense]SMP45205.1 hypothetical protein SAMN06296020_102278 [Anoxynatronum buryatiense]